MAEPNEHQAEEDPKIKCEYSSCAAVLARSWERRLHMKKNHRPLIQCHIPGCKWTTREMGRLRTHLKKAHPSKANINGTLHSEFRIATAQSLPSSSGHFSNPSANINPNFDPNPYPIYIDDTFWAQAHQSQPDGSESYAAFNNREAPRSEYSTMTSLSLASSTRAQVTPCRVYRPCRVRRRTRRTTARTSSTSPPLAHRDSITKSTLRCHSANQDNSLPSTRGVLDPFNVELMASFSALYV